MNKREKYDSTGIASSIFDNKKETNNAAYQREKYDSTGIVSSIYDNKKEIKNSKLDYDCNVNSDVRRVERIREKC